MRNRKEIISTELLLQIDSEELTEVMIDFSLLRWRQWQKKCEDDSETCNWLTANTKPCPKCSNPVEKNGGCNLVVCRCGQAFCWLCGAKTGTDHTWTQIFGHECGRWKDDLDKKIDEAQRNHKRYMFYFERWKGHKDSLKKEDEQRWFNLLVYWVKGFWCLGPLIKNHIL